MRWAHARIIATMLAFFSIIICINYEMLSIFRTSLRFHAREQRTWFGSHLSINAYIKKRFTQQTHIWKWLLLILLKLLFISFNSLSSLYVHSRELRKNILIAIFSFVSHNEVIMKHAYAFYLNTLININ